MSKLTRAEVREKIDLGDLNFDDLDLRGADFYSIGGYDGQTIQGARLAGASFKNSNLSGVSFNGASLHGANFLNANLDDASFYDARFDNTTMPDGSIRSGICRDKF